MKKSFLIILLLTAGVLSAQSLRSTDGRIAILPPQFVVMHEGIKWIQAGASEPVLVRWERIDLAALARDEPKIETARQQAMLTKKEIYFSIPAKPNYYREFLAQQINVKFQEKWKAVTTGRSEYDISTTGYIDYNSGGFSADSKVKGRTSETTRYIDQTRPALNTTMEGLLLQLGEDGKVDTHRLIQDLRDSGAVLQNVRGLFSGLREAYPNDHEITKSIAALDRLIAEKTTSVDAMRQLKNFAIHARSQSK